MRSIFQFAFALFLTIGSALPAFAESMTIPAGKTSVLVFWYTYNDNCSYGSRPKFRLTREPEHGTVSATWYAHTMGDDTQHCKGKPMKGMLVTYTPHKGYRGSDTVKFTLSGSGVHPGTTLSLGRGFRYDLTVK